MKTQNAIKILSKLTNFKDKGHIISAEIGSRTIEVSIYNRTDEGGFVGAVKVRHTEDHSDPRMDYFAGSYVPSLKKALKLAGV